MDINSLDVQSVGFGDGIEYNLYAGEDYRPIISKNVDLKIIVLNSKK